jgi:cytidylate kinase
MKDRVIAIDGPAASGKSTIANAIADRLNIPYINTGAMYRAVAWKAIASYGVTADRLSDEALQGLLGNLVLDYVANDAGKYEIRVNGEFPGDKLRSPEVTALSSPLSAVPSVRAYLLERQREFAQLGLIVMEGRDIGTVIFPHARYKFFLTASPEERARRRLCQNGEVIDGATLESVAKEIAQRDLQDSTRAVAPLKQAEDAVLIDSTGLEAIQVADKILDRVRAHYSTYRVSYGDTDQMGVVYYANYLEFFERSRTEMLRDAELPYRKLEDLGYYLPVSEVHCKYFASARYDDLLTFKSWVADLGNVRMVITTEIYCGDKLLVRGLVTLACVNTKGRPCRIPDLLSDACPIIPL